VHFELEFTEPRAIAGPMSVGGFSNGTVFINSSVRSTARIMARGTFAKAGGIMFGFVCELGI